MESHRYLGTGEHEPAIRSSTIVGFVVGNAHGSKHKASTHNPNPRSILNLQVSATDVTITNVVPTIAIEFILRARERREDVSEDGLIRLSQLKLLRRQDRSLSLLRPPTRGTSARRRCQLDRPGPDTARSCIRH